MRGCLKSGESGKNCVLLGKSSESAKHTTDKGELDECLSCLGQEIILAVEPAVKRQPREAALYHPALLDHHKATVATKGLDLSFRQFLSLWEPIPGGIGIGALHDFHGVGEGRFDPAFPFALVSTVGKR